MDDVLGELFGSLRLRDAFRSHWRARAPWGIRGPAETCAVLHYIVEGGCWATLAEEVELPGAALHLRSSLLRRGDVAIFPWGAPHVLSDRPGREVVPLAAVLSGRGPEGDGVVRLPGPGPETTMLCGGLYYNSVGESALYRALPPMMVVDHSVVRRQPLLHHTLSALAAEGQDDPVERELTSVRGFETALVLALRLALRAEAASRLADAYPSLRALCHPGISRALMAVYRRYGEHWTIDLLAREARMSRTAFTTVFRELVGESPGRHLTDRRMREAARLLGETGEALSVIPAAVGYRSSVGFHLAFRKWSGMTPGEYRDACSGRRGAAVRAVS
ncbi:MULTISPECIES: AraC family transcriptional regulator [Streptomycetaceae]|uniref:AraC family transcriptional regulator n=1 Tax=Streptantibioticus cattleyicolor (strain ATCC 35852 / DSM 46488 / JCM 4925 / NBRC 14057 / NRRL 8057) TaxID=1003195 RepID=F8K431_STREN|nr:MULTISPECIES: AraC family transcriptional regulator [Streptomycetaceae]AEW92569.1 AraC family transcriptional regulator [Streptantibioticus cattleyicolor NRRL 8057 = DSM 46488]MYS57353.1 helix-turn-helix domain-containing protein [Streptomyces sp. SID5468]CCB72925.1 DNA-binding domain-containing protein, AraC-type [Streptantibioticus cattleyicolor NRRL 8057 = DSM 46488]